MIYELNDLWPRYLAWWFSLTVSGSCLKAKVTSQNSRSQNEKCSFFRLFMRVTKGRIISCLSSSVRYKCALLRLRIAVSSKQGRYEEALDSLLAATECDRSSAHPHSSLAAVYSALGDRDNAATHYAVASQLAPRRPNVLLNYAMFLHRHGSRLHARSYFNYGRPFDLVKLKVPFAVARMGTAYPVFSPWARCP